MSDREDTTMQERRESMSESAGQRGTDDRRSPVRPQEDPAPVSPAPDRDSIDKGEDILTRIKPY